MPDRTDDTAPTAPTEAALELTLEETARVFWIPDPADYGPMPVIEITPSVKLALQRAGIKVDLAGGT